MPSNLRLSATHALDAATRPAAPPAWVLDREAERQMSGGFDTRRSNLCKVHHVSKAVNGACFLCE